MNLLAQVLPKMMSEAGLPMVAITLTVAIGDIDRFVDRIDNIRDTNIITTPVTDGSHRQARERWLPDRRAEV